MALNFESSYSPEFQLELFDIQPKTVMEPVLDISCGQDPQLVHLLRMEGVQAYGADYDAPELSYTKKASWVNSNFGHDKWGTILSNIDLSMTINKAVEEEPEAFHGLSLAYYNLLGCLKPGGKLIYAPSIPVLEDTLPPDMFTVTHREVKDGLEVTSITRLLPAEATEQEQPEQA